MHSDDAKAVIALIIGALIMAAVVISIAMLILTFAWIFGYPAVSSM